jgi:hypothetical protein
MFDTKFITIVCALRYVYNRDDYTTGQVVNFVIDNKADIPEKKREILVKEIRAKLRRNAVNGITSNKEHWYRLMFELREYDKKLKSKA